MSSARGVEHEKTPRKITHGALAAAPYVWTSTADSKSAPDKTGSQVAVGKGPTISN
jgi:hypothetical protein